MMIQLHKVFATGLGIGYMGKGGGTVAAIAACVVWYFACNGNSSFTVPIAITAIVTVYGIWSSSQLEPYWGKDSSKIVIDEIAGMFITMLFVPATIVNMGIGLVLFRFFDIAKPLFIRKLEKLPKGWGVMGDDVLAGIYANIILQIIVYANLW
jgi:phosphatidylglycerophosphatase A